MGERWRWQKQHAEQRVLEDGVPYVVLKAGRHDGRIRGDREVVVLGDCLGRVVQKEQEGSWDDRDEISRTDLP